MIIVEGPDGAGKTTLVNQLAEKFGLTVQPKLVTSDQQITRPPQKWVEDSIDLGWGPWLYDRHCLFSEYMYLSGPSARPRDGLDDENWLRTALMRFWNLRPVVVFCLPPWEAVWQNAQRDETNRRLFPNNNPHKLGAVYWRYWYEACGNPRIYTYDYTEGRAGELLELYISANLLREV